MLDLVGQRLGQYRIDARVARGATSTIYKAYQEKLDRYVAVKVLSPHFIDEPGFLDRFYQEARAVARLDHPNILPVYDFDQVGEIVYIVMKYVNTGTLRHVMHGPLDLPAKPTVVMIQCVESRDKNHPYCSRVCCSEAIKNALSLKRRLTDASVTILNRDIRTYGFRDDFYRQARQEGVRFVQYSNHHEPLVAEKDGTLRIEVHDMTSDRTQIYDADLLVLSTGIAPASSNPELSGILQSALTEDGFFLEAHPKLRPVDLSSEGTFVCGLAHSPRFIDEAIAQAQAVAGRASRILSKAQLEIAGGVSYVNPANCVACATCIKTCPYGAPMINALGKAEIQGAKCMGCGSCVAACPARAIALQHQESRTVTAMLDEALAGGGQG